MFPQKRKWVSEFVFNYLHLMYYKCHKINLSCGRSYADYPDWIKNKKATINPIKTDNEFFFFIRPALGHSQGHSLTNSMLITACIQVWLAGHWEPHSEVGSLSPAERLVGFGLGTFQFCLQCLNPLGHSSRLFSIRCNSCPELWRNRKTCWKNSKN